MQLQTMYSTIDGPVATLMLNRPDVLNCADGFTFSLSTLRASASRIERARPSRSLN